MYLKPQDVVILLKLSLEPERVWSYNQMAYELYLSPSEVHKGVKRSGHAGLYDEGARRVRLKALEEFLLHGVRYAYAPEIGTMTRGMPTAFASPGLRERILADEEAMMVWPDPQGEARGLSFSPLYKTVPKAAKRDEGLYAALGALDAVRHGRVRERRLAQEALIRMLRQS